MIEDFACGVAALAGARGARTPNISIDTDPQQQEAAAPHVLVVRSFLR